LSFAVLVFLVSASSLVKDYLLHIMLLTAWNVSIMILWITGIALYMYGYVRREATDTERKVILLFSFLLIAWAVLTYLVASGFYLDLIDWSKNPGVRTLTIWDHMEYWTWELKGILWIGTGLLLIVTSVMKRKLKDQKL
jgi:hypothetical protein